MPNGQGKNLGSVSPAATTPSGLNGKRNGNHTSAKHPGPASDPPPVASPPETSPSLTPGAEPDQDRTRSTGLLELLVEYGFRIDQVPLSNRDDGR